uniref:Thioredoxin n=1 Tax=Timspurckia oligopyrenoides TaxID=708627 RepID=A0A6T6M5W3_9RHOD|mmetsp:Transcript_3576/g.6250  ORF Transcript_3576/g.6250 Transcript_3576/m.6250 type:complete len:454 (+) Transcript_3576:59-1420(+)
MGIEYASSMNNFNDILKNSGNKLVVVDFYADWCGPCRAIAPLIENLSAQYSGSCVFVKVNVDEARDIAGYCGIRSMPTFHFYKNSKLVDEFSGANPGKLQETIARLAQAETFSGKGQVLGGSSASNATPKIDWSSAKVPPSALEKLTKPTEERAESVAEPKPDVAAPEASSENVTTENVTASDVANTEEGSVQFIEGVVEKLNQLMEMGFAETRALKALVNTRNGSVENAAEWIFEHMEDDDIDEPVARSAIENALGPNSKLTEEEKRAKAIELATAARLKREQEEKRLEIEREKNRIKSGKELAAVKAQFEEEQRRRNYEMRKREKKEQDEEKRRLRELLREDQEARKLKFAPKSAVVATAAESSAPGTTAGSSSSGGTIEIRFSDGTRLQNHFTPDQTVGDVIAFLRKERPSLGSFQLQSNYPRKVFTENDASCQLSTTGLLPRGALTVRM